MTDDDAATGDSKGGATGKTAPARPSVQHAASASQTIAPTSNAGNDLHKVTVGDVSVGDRGVVNIINFSGRILAFSLFTLPLTGAVVIFLIWRSPATGERSDEPPKTNPQTSDGIVHQPRTRPVASEGSDEPRKTDPATSGRIDKQLKTSPATDKGSGNQPKIGSAMSEGSDKQSKTHRAAASRIDMPSQPSPATRDEFDEVPKSKLLAFFDCIRGFADPGFCASGSDRGAKPLCQTAGKSAADYTVESVNSSGIIRYRPIGGSDGSVVCECRLIDYQKEKCIEDTKKKSI